MSKTKDMAIDMKNQLNDEEFAMRAVLEAEEEQWFEEHRICDITGEVMTEGFCISDSRYIKHEKDMLKDVKKNGYKDLSEAYDDGYYYWTTWKE